MSEEMGEHDDLPEGVFVSHDAFPRSKLPKGLPSAAARRVTDVNPLGMDEYEWFLQAMLANAGITVELINDHGHDHSPYEATQIVSTSTRGTFFRVVDMEKISFVPMEDMLGLQVKLNGACTWKITIMEENLEQHSTRQPARARSAAAAKSCSFQNMRMYEIAVGVKDPVGIKCTVALARTIVITLAFMSQPEDDDNDERSMWTGKLPHIAQRRVDVLFTNQYVTCLQVCACSRTRTATRTQNAWCGT